MRLSELAKMIELERMWEMTKASFPPEELPSREKFDKVIKESEVFFYAHGGVERGMTGIGIVTPGVNEAVIRSICTLPMSRNQGVCTKILQDIEEFYKFYGYKRLVLCAYQSNQRAQRVYLSFGFRFFRVIPDKYAPGVDGVVMVKNL